ncbi:MAG: type I phosphomannose isomerase catalytic subunit [Bryobacteraceae bacterium]
MTFSLTQPLVFEPIFQERVWGGRRLESVFGKALPAGKSIGESWEIVDRPEAQSVVRQGPLRGQTLHELWRDHRPEVFGEDAPETPRFPIFAKLLDAREKLSLQVHPPEKVATALGGEAKTEMWYLTEADPGAEIFFGLRRGTSRAQFEEAVASGEAADLVHRIAGKKGDAFFVPSGRLHAIGPGNLVVEIQQNSDTTYRVFDWNRVGSDGKPRRLHLAEAMRSIDFDDFEPEIVRPRGELLVESPLFVVEKWELQGARSALDGNAVALFICLSGTVRMANIELRAGEFFLVPAAAQNALLEPLATTASLLRVTL